MARGTIFSKTHGVRIGETMDTSRLEHNLIPQLNALLKVAMRVGREVMKKDSKDTEFVASMNSTMLIQLQIEHIFK
jgi:hypothetical protein